MSPKGRNNEVAHATPTETTSTELLTDPSKRAIYHLELLFQHIQAIVPVDLCLIVTPLAVQEFAEQLAPKVAVTGQHRNTPVDLNKIRLHSLCYAELDSLPLTAEKLMKLFATAQLPHHVERWRAGFKESRPLYIPALRNSPEMSYLYEGMAETALQEENPVSTQLALAGSLLLLPIKHHQELIGLLHLQTRRSNHFSANSFHLLSTLTPLIGSYLHDALQAAHTQQAYTAAAQERSMLGKRIIDFTAQVSSLSTELCMAQRVKDDFLAMMSHELRTPLTVIMTRCELLLSSGLEPLSTRQRDSLENVQKYAKKQLEQINSILDLVSMEAGAITLNLEHINTTEICQQVIESIRDEAAEHNLTVTTRLSEQPLEATADRYRLIQMLSNLLHNAIKFTPDGGIIGLEETYDPEKQMICFHVWDTGIGISQDATQKIFEPFVQLDSSLTRFYEGSGMGLNMVARLAELHGGNIAVSSAPGQGAQFTLTIPTSAAQEVIEEPDEPTPPFQFKRVFVVDSQVESIELLIKRLHAFGIQPHLHPHTQQLAAALLNFCPDVIIVNLSTEDELGWKALNQLLTLTSIRHIPIVTLLNKQTEGQQSAPATMYTAAELSRALERVQKMIDSSPVVIPAQNHSQ